MTFKALKEKISTLQAARTYGLVLTQKGGRWWAKCPFHGEKTPSFVIFPDGGFKCFGCGISGGDAIDFTAKLFHLSPGEALQKLAGDFGITLHGPNSKKVPLEKMRSLQEERDLLEGFERAVNYLYDEFCSFYRACLLALNTGDFNHPGYAAAAHYEPIIGYWLDILRTGTLDEQIQLVKEVWDEWLELLI